MSDSLRLLIRDTLAYLKDPLLPKQGVFAAKEECILFQRTPCVEEKSKGAPPAPPIPKRSFTAPPPVVAKAPVELEPPSSPPAIKQKPPESSENVSQIKATLLRIAPGIKLSEEIPDDTAAKRIASAWKEKITDAEVILLACEMDVDTLEFLKGLSKAIDQNLAKAKIIAAEKLEKENRWDLFLQKNRFRLIIASDGLQKLLGLMHFYKAIPSQSQYYLDKTPLLALSPASLYKSLEHKALLWKTLCQTLKK